MSAHGFKPDFSDKTRCISVHWSLPVQCVLPPTHRENWHEAWHPATGNRLRYRHPGKLTEELRHGEWRTIQTPIGTARIATIRSLYPGLPVVEELLGEIERLNTVATPDTDLDRMTPQTCPAGIHADWAVASDDDRAYGCPWCELDRLAAEVAKVEAGIDRVMKMPLHAHNNHWCSSSSDVLRALGDVAPAPTGEAIAGLLSRLAERAAAPLCAPTPNALICACGGPVNHPADSEAGR